MSAKRSTIPVREIVALGNRFLANSPDAMRLERKAVASFVANVLHRTGNYLGFSYLASAGMRNPGTAEVSFADDSRCCYSIPRPAKPDPHAGHDALCLVRDGFTCDCLRAFAKPQA